MLRIIGHFDGVEGSQAFGWVADTDAPDRVLIVTLFQVGPGGQTTELGRVRANRPRDDLRSIGLKNVNHGFEWRVPFLASPFILSARLAEHDWELPDSPVEVIPRAIYEGSFDGIDRGVARGWARAWDPSVIVEVEVFADGKLQGTAPAHTERPDLVLAHVGGGRHAFAWVVPDRLADGEEHEFACRIAGTSFWLGGCPRRAVTRRGDRSLGLSETIEARGCAKRPPLPSVCRKPSYESLLLKLRGERWRRHSAVADTAVPASVTAGDPLWRPLATARTPPAAASSHARARLVRLLIPVWGPDYIETFCRTGLASFLSPNNLPALARVHPLEVVFLTRGCETGLIEAYPAYQRLAGIAKATFIAIDDILARYFDPGPHAYAMALTYAFFRGITTMGEKACDTDFLFWNADFVAADGTFRTLAELIAAGIRCTYAPSLRVDRAIEEAELAPRRSADGAVLDMAPREWLALAARFVHPTVRAQTINRFEERMIDTVNQLYWEIDDQLMVGRVFLMFMLHIRPERVWPELYGHCDYVFVPEMVPSGQIHVETLSNRVLIIELQQHNREWQDVVSGDAPLTPAEVARGVDRWTTREHRLTSRHMVAFSRTDKMPDLAAARALTDAFLDPVYSLLSAEPVWHNGHFFWIDSLAALGESYNEPGPDHPRSHLAAALRWTGYDIDILHESWPDPAGPPAELFRVELPLGTGFDAGAWLAEAQARYLQTWREAAAAEPNDPAAGDLVSGHFHGFGWGLVERRGENWVRSLGPDGRSVLLLRVPRGRRARIYLLAAQDRIDGLGVFVNGRPAADTYQGIRAGKPTLRLDIGRGFAERPDGKVHILLCALPSAGIAFSGVEIAIR